MAHLGRPLRIASILLATGWLAHACNKEGTNPPAADAGDDGAAEAGDVGDGADEGAADGAEDAAADDGSGTPKAAGESCLAAGECESGVCEGEGCGDDQPGTCAEAERMCTRDLQQYCGCDGETFGASGSCPGARYSAKGPCPDAPGPA